MKIIIREKKSIFKIFNPKNVYTTIDIHSYSDQINYIDNSIYDAVNYRTSDNVSGDIVNKLCENYLKKNNFNFLSEWGGINFKEKFIKQSYLREVRKIVNEFNYANKVINQYSLKGKIYLWPAKISISLYNKLKKISLIENNISIHPMAKISLYGYEFLRFFYFFIKLIFYVECKFFSIKRRNLNKKKFNFANILYETLFEYNVDSEDLLKSRIFKIVDKNNTILVNEYDTNSDWVKKAKSDGYEALDLNKINSYISIKEYIKKNYLSDFIFKNKLILKSLIYPHLTQSFFEALKYRVLWNMFYTQYNILLCNRFMTSGYLSSNIVHKKNNSKTAFTYFSSTESLVKNPIKDAPICFDYANMIFDYSLSSNLSNKFIKLSQASIGKYLNIGPIYADLIIEAKKSSNHIKNINNIENYKKVISCFDNTFGYAGTQSRIEYLSYLNVISELCIMHKDYLFILKTKKKLENIITFLGYEGEKLLKKILHYPNIKIFNDTKITTYEIMAISDIIISAPLSSIIYEGFAGKVKTLVYDSSKNSLKLETISSRFPKIYSSNFLELNNSINYWLNHVTVKDFELYLEKNVKQYINISNKNSKLTLINMYNEKLHKIIEHSIVN